MTSSQPIGSAGHPQRDGADVPAAQLFGIGETQARPDGGVALTIERRPDAVDAEGAMPVGILGLAADHALGGAIGQVIADDEVMITSHMHLELVRPLTPELDAVVAHGDVVHKGGGHAFTRGSVLDPDGRLLALMTARFAMLPLTAAAGGYVRSEGAATEPASQGPSRAGADGSTSPVLELLRLAVVRSSPDGLTARFEAHDALANERQGVHGGVGVLIAERALDCMVRTLDADARFRAVELRAVFLRPLAADGTELRCDVEVGYAGRSVIAGRATLQTPAGKAAVVVDTIHAAGRG